MTRFQAEAHGLDIIGIGVVHEGTGRAKGAINVGVAVRTPENSSTYFIFSFHL